MPLWQARARLIKSVVDGDCVRLTSRRQSDSEDRRKPNRLDTKNSRHPIRQALQLFKLLACNVKTFLLGDQKGDILFCEREYPPLPAPLRVRRDYQFVLTNNFSHGMLTTTKGIEKEAFSFHPLKRGDGRCKSLRNGKGGAFEPRGGNAAPVPPLQGNEVPRIQRGIQVEPRTMICSP